MNRYSNYDIYIENKSKYIELVSLISMSGGQYEKISLEQQIVSDLHQINQDLDLHVSDEYLDQQEQMIEKKQRSRAKKKVDKKQIKSKYLFKLSPDIKLSGKYLEWYNLFVGQYYKPLFDAGYYDYKFKLKQHLNECGLNRTTQLYGTCWLNTIINGFVFGKNFGGRFLQLISKYKENNKDFYNTMKKINKSTYRLTKKIEKDEILIFQHLVSILYKILCEEGLRNKNPDKYENFTLTNLAINLRVIEGLREEDPIKILLHENIGYSSTFALYEIIEIFNRYIDPSPFDLHQTNHINTLRLDISKKYLFFSSSLLEKNRYYANIDVAMFQGNQEMSYNVPNLQFPVTIDNLDNIQFLIVNILGGELPITLPETIECYVRGNRKKTTFRLEYTVIAMDWKTKTRGGGHVISGFICDKEYYVYDQQFDAYFKIDWTNIKKKTFDPYIQYNILLSGEPTKYSNFAFLPAIYYNTDIDFSYDFKKCKPKRPIDDIKNKFVYR
ncbi:MAG: hypothetical protein Dasosvirus11_4 [Dasosvirus sp.]|uniref:Uncharacterized protein n=1 Tax=Dasosvirus sp. TaxID=2487764 RepID=A0A3G4ZVF4_9VIRU|nr:MAG: hypothetical protein Dasosvirus11_4 [Dasosvirus sp.]